MARRTDTKWLERGNVKFWPRWVGDWKKKTIALTLAERGAYGELLDHAYVTEEPLPADHRALYRICGAMTPDECSAVDRIMGLFFVRSEAGYTHQRVAEEIAKQQHRSDVARAKAEHRWMKAKPAHKGNGEDKTPKPQDSGEVVERIPLIGGTEFEVRQSFAEEMNRLYLNVDIPATLREIRGWCLGNPTRLKTPRGVRKFIVSWMQREQDKHGRPQK